MSEPTPTPTPTPPPPPSAPAEPPAPVWDAAAWDRAGLKAALLGTDTENEHPPFIALQFKDDAAGRELFTALKQRLSGRDGKDQLRIAIVQSGDGSGYDVQVGPPGAARSVRNTPPATSTNLAEFKKAFAHHKRLTLIPVTVTGSDLNFEMELAIDKPALHISTTF